MPIEVCKRRPVSKFPASFLPIKWIEDLEQNQLISSCCRHPENHEISAYKSKEDEPSPDIYIFHCPCGRNHTRLLVGGGDIRPVWEIR